MLFKINDIIKKLEIIYKYKILCGGKNLKNKIKKIENTKKSETKKFEKWWIMGFKKN